MERNRDQALLPGAIEAALERGEFEVWYQPQLDLSTGALSRFEALVRWRHPAWGVLLPKDFLALAVETAEIGRLGEFVLNEAVRQVGVWRDLAPHANVGVSVNLSAQEVVDERLPRAVESALTDHGVPAHLLTVELTESSLMAPASVRAVEALRDLGVGIAVDNFGTGFSSLSRLRRLGVHYLQIDRTLVAGLCRDEHDSVVVEAVVVLAHTLGMKAVAEGVETLDQLGRLSDLGCDFAQGFYWSKAMLSEDARRMVSRALVQLAG
jgi:diguanylate cyclase